MDAGRRLTTDGGGGYFFFVIDSGTAEVTHDGALLATFGPGDFFGESAYLRDPPAHRDRDDDVTGDGAGDVRCRLRIAHGPDSRTAEADRRGNRRPTATLTTRPEPSNVVEAVSSGQSSFAWWNGYSRKPGFRKCGNDS